MDHTLILNPVLGHCIELNTFEPLFNYPKHLYSTEEVVSSVKSRFKNTKENPFFISTLGVVPTKNERKCLKAELVRPPNHEIQHNRYAA